MRALLLSLTVAAFFWNDPALATSRGVIAHENGDCALIYTELGFTLVEWFGGGLFNEGNQVVGDLDSFGMKDIFDIGSDREIRVWIENFWLSEDDAIEQFYEKCG